MSGTNSYCEALRISVPKLEAILEHADANAYSFLIVALLERGAPMTLLEVAERFEEVGITSVERALHSLQRCRPARPPVYRDGDHYALDPHDDELDLWAFRLGLRPPQVPRLSVVTPSVPTPGIEVRLTIAELDEAWRDADLRSWSDQRIALAVLDAHDGPLTPEEVRGFVLARTPYRLLRVDPAQFGRRGSPVSVLGDGRWSVVAAGDALASARRAVRERIEVARRWASYRPDPAVLGAQKKAIERKRAEHARELAELRRVLVYAFPARAPAVVVLLDVAEHSIATYVAGEIDAARDRILGFDVIGAIDVRALVRALEVDVGERRLVELGPPQKSKTLNRRGRALKITTALLVQGSCGISRAFGDEKVLAAYLRDGQATKLKRRLEADAKSLFALYQYGRLHGAVRLRWGFLDEMIPAPWVHRDEPTLYDLKRKAHDLGVSLEVVAGTGPGWDDPWARARVCEVVKDQGGYGYDLVDDDGFLVDDREVQSARLSVVVQ